METQKFDIEKKRKAAQKLDILEKRKKNFGTEIFPQLNPSIFASLSELVFQ
jgi:hypothetical protein